MEQIELPFFASVAQAWFANAVRITNRLQDKMTPVFDVQLCLYSIDFCEQDTYHPNPSIQASRGVPPSAANTYHSISDNLDFILITNQPKHGTKIDKRRLRNVVINFIRAKRYSTFLPGVQIDFFIGPTKDERSVFANISRLRLNPSIFGDDRLCAEFKHFMESGEEPDLKFFDLYSMLPTSSI